MSFKEKTKKFFGKLNIFKKKKKENKQQEPQI